MSADTSLSYEFGDYLSGDVDSFVAQMPLLQVWDFSDVNFQLGINQQGINRSYQSPSNLGIMEGTKKIILCCEYKTISNLMQHFKELLLIGL